MTILAETGLVETSLSMNILAETGLKLQLPYTLNSGA